MEVKHFLSRRIFCFTLLLPCILAAALDSSCLQEEKLFQEVDISKVKSEGNTVETLTATNVTNLQECGKACCQFNQCSVAHFLRDIKTYNCLLISCKPIESCITKPSTDISTIIIKSSQENNDQSKQKEEPKKESSHSGSVKPRKGVVLPPTPDHVHSSEETVHYQETKKPSVARKGVPDEPGVVNTTTKKTLLRQEEMQSISSNVTDVVAHAEVRVNASNTEEKNSSKQIDKTNGTVVISKSNTTNEFSLPSSVTNSPALPDKSESVPIKINFPENVTHLVMSNSSLQFGREGPREKTKILGKTPLAEKESKVELTTEIIPPTKPSTTSVSITTTAMKISVENINIKVQVAAESNIPVKNDSVSSTMPKNDSDDLDQFLVTANIHLIIALVIGLLILLTVIGLILRRVHDVWQRRHYQRMDFLIDGMYNNTMT